MFYRLYLQFRILLGYNATRHGIALLTLVLLFVLKHFTFSPQLTLSLKGPFDQVALLISLVAIGYSLDIFRVLRLGTAGMHYQLIPATITEKWLAALLYSTVYTVLIYCTAFLLTHLLVVSGASLFMGEAAHYHFPGWTGVWDSLKTLLFFQSIFFLGAVIFRKNPLFKTLIVLIACLVVFSLVIGLLLKHQMHVNNLTGSYAFDGSKGFAQFKGLEQLEALSTYLHVFSWVLPFACWGGAWYRLKTIQH